MFIVIEIQTNADGHISTIVNDNLDENIAEQTYHLILAAASVSSVAVHSAVMMSKDGRQIKRETYYHPFEEVEEAE